MDQTTHDVRANHWRSIVESCQARPSDQTAKAWLAENNVSAKSYYYWLRKFRREAYNQMHATNPDLPALQEPVRPEGLGIAEIPAENIFAGDGSGPAVTIRTKAVAIEIHSGVSETTMVELVKAVAHAL